MLKLADKKLTICKAIATCIDIILSNNPDNPNCTKAVDLYKVLSQNIMPCLRDEEKAEETVAAITEEIADLSNNSFSQTQSFKSLFSQYLNLSDDEVSILAVSFFCGVYKRFLLKSAKGKFIPPRIDMLRKTLGCATYRDIPDQLEFINEILGIKVPEFIGDDNCKQLASELCEKLIGFDFDSILYAVYHIFKKSKLENLYTFYESHNMQSRLQFLNEKYAGLDPETFVDTPSYKDKTDRLNFVKGLQKYTLETLVLTKEFLEKHNLRFYLTEGTLLGAIRHKGFIPWDDDVDIAMPRDDYEKLVELAKNGEIPPELNFDALENNPKHWVLGAKMQLVRPTPYIQHKVTELSKCNGPYVDIFPLDYWNDPAGIKVHLVGRLQNICRRMLFMKTGYSTATKKKPERIVLKFFLPFISNRTIEKIAIKNMTKYSNGNRRYLVNLCSYYPYYEEVFPTGFFGEPIYVDFEGYKMPVPQEYDYMLKTIYSRSYDTIPPVGVTKMRKHAFDLCEDIADED